MQDRKIVYSTAPDFQLQLEAAPETVPPAEQDLRIHLERRRGGKLVTVIKGWKGPPQEWQTVGQRIKKECGTGGTLKGDTLLVQGDFRDRILATLKALGYRAKKAGG